MKFTVSSPTGAYERVDADSPGAAAERYVQRRHMRAHPSTAGEAVIVDVRSENDETARFIVETVVDFHATILGPMGPMGYHWGVRPAP